jgi:hypothetical protein
MSHIGYWHSSVIPDGLVYNTINLFDLIKMKPEIALAQILPIKSTLNRLFQLTAKLTRKWLPKFNCPGVMRFG